MADFATDVSRVAEGLREAAKGLDELVREINWGVQDALNGSAQLPCPDPSRPETTEQLALQYAARTLAPARIRQALDTLDGTRTYLQRIRDHVAPIPPDVSRSPAVSPGAVPSPSPLPTGRPGAKPRKPPLCYREGRKRRRSARKVTKRGKR